MYHEVPLLDAWGHPKPGNKKLLASIVSILTLPKFHLATFNPSVIIHLSGIWSPADSAMTIEVIVLSLGFIVRQ